MSSQTIYIRNGQNIAVQELPLLSETHFIETLAGLLSNGGRLCSFFGLPAKTGLPGKTAPNVADPIELWAVCADDIHGKLHLCRGLCTSGHFPSLTPDFPQAHLFEREIHEQTGAVPDGHPWLKPVRFPFRSPEYTAGTHSTIGEMDFFRIAGEEIHEVAVGPVHAGVIEPGHFRFQCHGEEVHHLEISLGYQHRGIEGAVMKGPHPITPYQMEVTAGDTTIGHMTAYCQAMESLSRRQVSPQAALVRAIALELERCANHTGDLGALAGDVGYLPTMSYCGRIRGDFLNLTALMCGNRFGRGIVVPGGVGFRLDEKQRSDLLGKLNPIFTDFLGATGLLWEEASVMDRFEATGTVTELTAESIGLVGPAARACGCVHDVRQDHPYGHYRFAHIPVCTHDTGDVFGRAYVRWREIQASVEFLVQTLTEFDNPEDGGQDTVATQPGPLAPDALTVSLVEGWRGEICHVAITDKQGAFRGYKIVDPSFHNWFGLALALRGQAISDFPLCNKSFNLSYCGFDL